MEPINKFIMNLAAIIVFMTAIEIVAPDNAMKKYIKFVLGLILIAFMINPIVYFASHGETIITQKIQDFSDEATKAVTEKSENDDSSKKLIEENFIKNFQKDLNDKLEEKYPQNLFESKIEGKVDFENMKYNLERLYVYVEKNEGSSDADNKGDVKRIEKVVIGNDDANKNSSSQDQYLNEVANYISENINISKDKIVVRYK